MIDPNMTEDQVAVRYDELQVELEAARLEMKDSPEQWARHEVASRAMAEFRSYWRALGELTHFGHPNKRAGIKITNNDGSVTE